jgi:hypothetical protein
MLSSETLWSKFANYENFLLAWQRTVNGTSRMVHDELGMKTFAYNLQTNLEDLVRQIKAEDFPYTPLADHKVYVPKPSTTLRTMSLMAVSDVIVYQALVNVIADQSHPYLVTHENQHILGICMPDLASVGCCNLGSVSTLALSVVLRLYTMPEIPGLPQLTLWLFTTRLIMNVY